MSTPTTSRPSVVARCMAVAPLPQPTSSKRSPAMEGVDVVVTAGEIAGIEVFAVLGADEQERLARASADVCLVAGEYAANEGDDRALFAVLEGRIEAVKDTGRDPRIVGERLTGDVFGEVPMVLGTFFPVGFRAAIPSRVLRISPSDYHAVAAVD